MHLLVAHVLKHWPQQLSFDLSYQVGLSGGVDSVVLLHILTQVKEIHTALDLSAIHINHGLSPNANLWSDFCQQYCDSLGIVLYTKYYQIIKCGGQSIENNARIARYQEFISSSAKIIILAHHLLDQVETTLSQVFRGSDLHNIASMRELSNRQGKFIWRPLLGVAKQEIEDYALKYQLHYVDDESNLDKSYLRNFIRHVILPQLNVFDNNIKSKILKLPNQIQSMLAMIDELSMDDLANVSQYIDGNLHILIKPFSALRRRRQYNVMVNFIKQQHIPLPTSSQLEEFIRQALTSGWDKSPSLKLSKVHNLIKSRGFIFINVLI